MREHSASTDFLAVLFGAAVVAMIFVTLLLGLMYGVIRASQRGTIKPGVQAEPVQIEEYPPAEQTA